MALRGTNQEFGRPYNRRIVLETIRLHGPTTRAEIAKRVGLTLQTVSTITSELQEQGFLVLRPSQGRSGRRGFPAPSLALDPDGGFACGIHVTPRELEGALINIAGDVVERSRIKRPRMSAEVAFAEIARLTRELVSARPSGRMLGVGLAMPGPFDIESMSFVGPTTMEGWRGVPVRERLHAATGLPAFVGTDTAAAAHGECLYGVGTSFENFYYLYFGVGLGGGAILDGKIVRGAFGNAGEIGHIPLVPDGDPCPCGNRGCMERYVSFEAYERRVAEVGEAAWLKEVAPILRSAIVTIENMFDPQTIVMGGLAPAAFLRLLFGLAERLPASIAARGDRTAPRVVLSTTGADAVLRGAAALAVSGVLSPRFGQLFGGESDGESADPLVAAGSVRRIA